MTPFSRTVLASFLAVTVVFADDCQTQQPEPSPERIDEALMAFCDAASTMYRGVAFAPIGYTTDGFVLRALSSDVNDGLSTEHVARFEAFRQWFGWTEAQGKACAAAYRNSGREMDRRRHLPLGVRTTAMDSFDLDASSAREFLENTYKGDKQDQLMAAYLSVEGLMALRRDAFVRRLALTMYQQIMLRAWIDQGLRKSLDAQRTLFVVPDTSVEIIEQAKDSMRSASRSLDVKILGLLTNDQKAQLLEFVSLANETPRINFLGSGVETSGASQ